MGELEESGAVGSQAVNENNTVDVSEERISEQWAAIQSRFGASEPPPVDHEGKEIPDIKLGGFCCMVADLAVDQYAPNWKVEGLTEEDIKGVGYPAGAVLEKYLLKWLPDVDFGRFVKDNYLQEYLLLMAVWKLNRKFSGVPRITEEQSEQLKTEGKKGWFGWLKRGKNGDS